MKITVNKKDFTLDEKDLVAEVKANLKDCLTFDIVQDCIRFVLQGDRVDLVNIEGAEICKNHFRATIWINAVARGYDHEGAFFAEVGFDFAEALSNDERAKDAYITKYYRK